jgi:hypothetical protein
MEVCLVTGISYFTLFAHFFVNQKLEAQEKCDENVESLTLGLSRMLPYLELVKKLAMLEQLQKTMAEMLHLIEDASGFIIEYKSDGAAGI